MVDFAIARATTDRLNIFDYSGNFLSIPLDSGAFLRFGLAGHGELGIDGKTKRVGRVGKKGEIKGDNKDACAIDERRGGRTISRSGRRIVGNRR